MTLRGELPFVPLGSSEPSFNITLDTTSQVLAIASTVRVFSGPTGRALRFAESSGVDYYAQFGSSTVVAQSSASPKMLGGVVEVLRLLPSHTHVALVTTSTQISDVNMTPGYGR